MVREFLAFLEHWNNDPVLRHSQLDIDKLRDVFAMARQLDPDDNARLYSELIEMGVL